MKFKVFILGLLSIVLLGACSDQDSEKDYELDDIVATFNGYDITVKDIISQFSLTDENIENYLKQEIIIDEAKNTGFTVSEESIKQLKNMVYPNAESVDMKNFNAKEAKALGMTNDEYFDMWTLTYLTRNEYFQTYIKSKFGDPTSIEEGEEWGKEIESYINNLYDSYIENDVLIIH
jgi:hypothetical protein